MNRYVSWCTVSALLAVTPALAQDGKGISLGSGWTVAPGVSVDMLHDSNFYRQQQNEQSASGAIVRPELGLEYLTRGNQFRLTQSGEFGAYNTESYDDYQHYDIGFDARLNQTGRHRFRLSALRDEGHDPFGTERTEVSPITQRDVDEFVNTSGEAAYTFGSPSATVNATLFAGGAKREYQNNRDVTAFLDRDRVGGGGELRVRVGPRTGLLLDVSHYDIKFDTVRPTFSSRDGTEQRARLGMQWQASSKTTGRFLVGALRREMDADDRADFDAFDWEVALSWQPTSYSEVIFESGRSTQESYFEQSNFINVEQIGVRWRQGWTPRLYSNTALFATRYKFEGFVREDELLLAQVRLGYEVTRQFTTEIGVDAQDRNSNQDQFDFDRFVSHLRLQLKF